jgi:hypothetical protein
MTTAIEFMHHKYYSSSFSYFNNLFHRIITTPTLGERKLKITMMHVKRKAHDLAKKDFYRRSKRRHPVGYLKKRY